MPEGDSIHRAAASLHAALAGRSLGHVVHREHDARFEALAGRTVESVRARGKNLLIEIAGQRVIYSHLGMKGRWRVARREPLRAPARPGRATLVLGNDTHEAALYSPLRLEVLRSDQLRVHPILSRLGPDILDPAFDVEASAGSLAGDGRPVGVAFMDQRHASGIGNVYKSELLFLAGIDPFLPAARVGLARMSELLRMARRSLRVNLHNARRTTTTRDRGTAVWVYRRAGEACLKCGARIEMRRQGEKLRSTYYCPVCQGVSAP